MDKNDLFESAWKNDTDALQRALAAGADPNEQHPRAGTLPLQLACQRNAIEAIRMLLEAGAKADATFTRVSRVDGRLFANHTPLMYAESVEAASLLVDAGAKLEAADEKGWTALVWAAHSGNLPLTTFLVEQGADVSVQPMYAGKRRSLCEFLDAAMDPLPGHDETEARKARCSQLISVRDFIAARMHT